MMGCVDMNARSGTVAAVHFFTRQADGVSLQMRENHDVLSRMGWEVVEVSADAPEDSNGIRLPELDYRSPEIQALKAGDFSLEQANKIFNRQTQEIKQGLKGVIDRFKPSVFHARNMLSLPIHPAATIAMAEFISEHSETSFVTQHHDFVFESDFSQGDRQRQYALPYPAIQERVDGALLWDGPNVRHAVISTLAQKNLEQQRSIHAEVIHDSFDFDTQPVELPDLRERFGVRENDIVIGMMTRIAPRKAIEIAIQFVAELQRRKKELLGSRRGIHVRTITDDSRFILLLPQKAGLDEAYNKAYYDRLSPYATALGVDILYIGDNVVADNSYIGQPDKVPFYSVYSMTDIVVYPSYQEGFGNQFLEAAVLGKGVVVSHEYPVFETDILPVVSRDGIISLGNNNDYVMQPDGFVHLDETILHAAIDKEIYFLLHPEEEKTTARQSCQRLKRVFDSRAVGRKLADLLSN
jgi:mannosylglucosylglycerate synthase